MTNSSSAPRAHLAPVTASPAPSIGADPPLAADALELLLREALRTCARTSVTNRVMLRALAIHGSAQVPNAPRALRAFLEGPLFAAISEKLGDDAADAVLAEVRLILCAAVPGVATALLPRASESASATEPPPESGVRSR